MTYYETLGEPYQTQIANLQEENRRLRALLKKDDRHDWTTTPPDQPGWYWFRLDSEYPECVEIYDHADKGLCVGGGLSAITLDAVGGEWWPARIEEPKQ